MRRNGRTTRGGDRGPWIAARIRPSDQDVLDVGCSYGWLLSELRDPSRRLVGVDMDAPALDRARALVPEATLVHQTAAELPFPDAAFDAVVLSDVIEHVGPENQQGVLKEVHRVLRPQGRLLFTAPYAGLTGATDPMDVKRRWPWLYSAFQRRTGYVPTTEARIGHQHVSDADLSRWLASFVIEEVAYTGVLTGLLTWILAANNHLHFLSGRTEARLNQFRAWESGLSVPKFLAYNVRLTAVRR